MAYQSVCFRLMCRQQVARRFPCSLQPKGLSRSQTLKHQLRTLIAQKVIGRSLRKARSRGLSFQRTFSLPKAFFLHCACCWLTSSQWTLKIAQFALKCFTKPKWRSLASMCFVSFAATKSRVCEWKTVPTVVKLWKFGCATGTSLDKWNKPILRGG